MVKRKSALQMTLRERLARIMGSCAFVVEPSCLPAGQALALLLLMLLLIARDIISWRCSDAPSEMPRDVHLLWERSKVHTAEAEVAGSSCQEPCAPMHAPPSPLLAPAPIQPLSKLPIRVITTMREVGTRPHSAVPW